MMCLKNNAALVGNSIKLNTFFHFKLYNHDQDYIKQTRLFKNL